MNYKIKFKREAKTDIKQTKDWYDTQRKGLGKDFFEALKKRLNFLSNNPYAYTSRYNQIRQALVTDYPYSVCYYIEESKKHIIVIAVTHTSRHPKSWKEREK